MVNVIFYCLGESSTGDDLLDTSDEEAGIFQVHIRQRKHDYSLHDKKLILLEQKERKWSNLKIAQKYHVNESSIRYWQRTIDLSLDYSKDKTTMHPGRNSVGFHLESHLCQFIDSLRDEENYVTVELIAFEIIKMDATFQDGNMAKVKRWVYRFLERNGYSIRETTHVAQKLLNVDECLDFVIAVNEKNVQYSIPPEFVINMDETPLYNDQKPNKCVTKKGAKSVNGKSTRTGDYRATVLLAVTASGVKLKPMVVFKAKPGKTTEKSFNKAGNNFPQDVVCTCQENAWSDTNVMLKWVEKIYIPYISSSNQPHFSHLLMDDFGSHKVDAVQNAVKIGGSFLSILPGGSTSRIQVLDVGLNKPFKDGFRSNWVKWMANENRNNKKIVTREMLANWVSEIWRKVEARTICSTWEKIGYY